MWLKFVVHIATDPPKLPTDNHLSSLRHCNHSSNSRCRSSSSSSSSLRWGSGFRGPTAVRVTAFVCFTTAGCTASTRTKGSKESSNNCSMIALSFRNENRSSSRRPDAAASAGLRSGCNDRCNGFSSSFHSHFRGFSSKRSGEAISAQLQLNCLGKRERDMADFALETLIRSFFSTRLYLDKKSWAQTHPLNSCVVNCLQIWKRRWRIPLRFPTHRNNTLS